jgi:hypothetical protein
MIEKLLQWFRSRKTHWSYYTLYTKINGYRASGSFPAASSLPDTLTFPSNFWQEVKALYEYTLKDGYERAVSVWWVDDEIVLAPYIKGEKESVTSKYDVSVKYEPHSYDGYVTKTVTINDKVVFSSSVTPEEIPPKSTITMLFTLHTHPPHFPPGSSKAYYSFYSRVDLESLIYSDSLMLGLITDEVHILVRTILTPTTLGQDVHDFTINPEKLHNDLHLVQYKGSWNTAMFQKVYFGTP